MKRVSHLLEAKGRELYTIAGNATVEEAVARMAEHNIGALLVTDGAQLEGIISERDVLRRLVLQHLSPSKTLVSRIATPAPVCVSPSDTIDDCMSLMTAHRIRHLPVLIDSRLVGVISIGDVVKDQLEERGDEIHNLQDYITGKYPA